MADVPNALQNTHNQSINHIALPKNEVTKSLILDAGVQRALTVGIVIAAAVRTDTTRQLLNNTTVLSGVQWAKEGIAPPVVTDNFAIAPDGSLTAARVAFGASTGSRMSNSTPITPGLQCTTSWWVRSASGTRTVRIGTSFNNAGEFSDFVVTETWQRAAHTGFANNNSEFPLVSNQEGTAGDIYVWHPQFELGSVATAYTPAI
jgi:hypothetical protein